MNRFFAWIAMVALITTSAWGARVLQDETGRQVTLPDRVNRVISLTPSITDTIYALGAQSQLIAITDYTQYPPDAAKQKPSIGDILKPSLERIAVMHPDVVFAVSTLNSAETVRGLERIGIPVFLVTGRGLAGLYSSITEIGRVLGREKEASALLSSLKSREQRVRDQGKRSRHPSVFLALQLDPCITAGKGAFITELIGVAGLRSVTADLAQDWLRVSLEAILPRNPDYILIMYSAPFGTKDMQSRTGWSALEAVKRGRVIRADDRLQVPGPTAFDGLEDLARRFRQVAN